MSELKAKLRQRLRRVRREHVQALPEHARGLLFLRPPQPLVAAIRSGAVIGLYAETPNEPPASRYARWFFERGHPIALPYFASREGAMEFRAWDNPFLGDSLARGPWGIPQPPPAARALVPGVVFVPLLGFTADGDRLGHGAGHYDRWLAAHPEVTAIGLAWECQLVETLPLEPHDRRLDAVVTPARLYGAPA